MNKERTSDQRPLSPAQIRLLDNAIGSNAAAYSAPRVFADEYHMNTADEIECLISSGYMRIGTVVESVPFYDMTTLRTLAKAKGLKAGGKKADLIQRILENYSPVELNGSSSPRYYVLTETGERIIEQNAGLLLFLKYYWPTKWAEPEEIIDFCEAHPEMSAEDALSHFLKNRINGTTDSRDRFFLLNNLLLLCHDDAERKVIEAQTRALGDELDKEREAFWSAKEPEIEKALGLSLEERRTLQQQAIDEMDDDWERELDARNRAKAGIE